jgi:hypothetical protein
MKRASYREAIQWIADNDGSGDLDALNPTVVSWMVSCILVATIFGVPEERVGKDVVRQRRKDRKK